VTRPSKSLLFYSIRLLSDLFSSVAPSL
jgi:hypothetical protein